MARSNRPTYNEVQRYVRAIAGARLYNSPINKHFRWHCHASEIRSARNELKSAISTRQLASLMLRKKQCKTMEVRRAVQLAACKPSKTISTENVSQQSGEILRTQPWPTTATSSDLSAVNQQRHQCCCQRRTVSFDLGATPAPNELSCCFVSRDPVQNRNSLPPTAPTRWLRF